MFLPILLLLFIPYMFRKFSLQLKTPKAKKSLLVMVLQLRHPWEVLSTLTWLQFNLAYGSAK